MADLDIEAMLEAPFKAAEAARKEASEQNGDDRMDEDKDEKEKKDQKEEKSSRSRSEKKSGEEKRSSKEEKKEKSRRKSRSRERSTSRSRDRQREKDKKGKEKDRDREKEKDRDRAKDKDREREKDKDKSRSRRKSRSRSRDRDRRRRSRTKSRSRSRERSSRRRHSRSRSRDRDRERRRRSPSRERRRSRSRSKSRERSSRRERTPLTDNERKIKDYISTLSKEEREKLDDEIDRTERSLICMQLSVKLRDKELMEFFMGNDVLVRDARIISDRNSRRSKGIAYVELLKKDDMQRALGLSGQRLQGVPILIQYSQAEKNRQAGQTTVGPTKIYVTSLHSNLSESDIKNIFQPFGDIDNVTLQKDNSGRSQGFCFINFKKPDHAKLAIEQMNGFELAGKKLKVGWENEKSTIDSVDDETDRGGMAMTSQSRLELMQKLAQSKDVGMPVPTVMSPSLFPAIPSVPGVSAPGVAGVLPFVPPAAAVVPGAPLAAAVPGLASSQPSQCLMLRNMFDPNKEKDEHWAEDLEEDVEDEAGNYGKVVHIHVDRDSKQGAVYLKYDQATSATAAFTKLNGRWFDGQMIIAEYVPVATYAQRFPDAA